MLGVDVIFFRYLKQSSGSTIFEQWQDNQYDRAFVLSVPYEFI